MAQVNVLIAVDGASLASRVADGSLSAGTQSSPTALGSYSSSDVFISMVAQHSYATNDQGGSELTITVNSNDEVVWNMTTFDNNTDYTAFLYNGHFNPNDISGPLYSNSQVENYLPAGTDPTVTPSAYTNTVYPALGIVTKVGVSIQYTLSFTLVDNSNGNVIGYFVWDPFIKVNGPS